MDAKERREELLKLREAFEDSVRLFPGVPRQAIFGYHELEALLAGVRADEYAALAEIASEQRRIHAYPVGTQRY
jgi:hypothetical protein